MKRNELKYEEQEDQLARQYREGKIAYEDLIEKLVDIRKREELSKLLDELVIVFPRN